MGATMIEAAASVTEWYSRVDGSIESCGEASVVMAAHVLKGTPATAAEVTAASNELVANRQTTDYPHASTSPSNLIWLFRHRYGVAATDHSGDWLSAVRTYVGSVPVVLGVGNATVFGGPDANVHGHYICIFGRSSNGEYVVGDPNTSASTRGEMVTYSESLLTAARPFGAIVPAGVPLGGGLLGGALGTAITTATQPVNSLLRAVPGMAGVCESIHRDETLTAPNLSSVLDLPGYAWSNGRAWVVRSLTITVACILLCALLLRMVKDEDSVLGQMGGATAASTTPAATGVSSVPATAAASGAGDELLAAAPEVML